MTDRHDHGRDACLTEGATRRLGAFVVRARRVEAHSLAADRPKLLGWAEGQASVTVYRDGRPSELKWSLPSEEALDSLAARCRPFVLQRESVYHAKVMKSLGYLLRDHEELKGPVREIKTLWQRLDPSSSTPLGFDSQTGPTGGSLGHPVTDVALAYAWLYGDLVHADDVSDRVAGHNIDARYHGAVLVLTSVAVQAITTLNLIRHAQDIGLLRIDGAMFTERIAPRTEDTITLTGFATAPVGTPREQLEAMLDNPAQSASDAADTIEPEGAV